MLLAVDVGNTNTVFGVVDGAGSWLTQWRVNTFRLATADDWASVVLPLAARDRIVLDRLEGVAVGSVVPSVTTGLAQFIAQATHASPLIVQSSLDLGIKLCMDNPHEVGADRLANAVAVWDQFGSATIVVDLGTATKVEAIDDTGAFLGGAIAPGLGVMLDTLTARAARLFAVELRDPGVAIGRNTVAAMQSGLIRGHVHMLRGLIGDISVEMDAGPRVVITGGFASTILPSLSEPVTYLPNLTLEGIRLIHRRNTPALSP